MVTDAVPAVLRLGCCIAVWSETGDPLDAGTAFRRHLTARLAWCRARGLDTHGEMATLGPSSGPWSATEPAGVERLASLGHSPHDLDRLRVEAQRHGTATTPTTSRSPR